MVILRGCLHVDTLAASEQQRNRPQQSKYFGFDDLRQPLIFAQAII
jgi:hypothetical protein